MAILDEELRQDAIDDAKAIAYIRENVPAEVVKNYSDEQLQDILDIAVEQLAASDILEEEPDADGFVDFPIEELARKVTEQLTAEEIGNFPQEDVLLIVETWFDFEEQNMD